MLAEGAARFGAHRRSLRHGHSPLHGPTRGRRRRERERRRALRPGAAVQRLAFILLNNNNKYINFKFENRLE